MDIRFLSGEAACVNCSHVWTAVVGPLRFPLSNPFVKLQCPNCKKMEGLLDCRGLKNIEDEKNKGH